MARNVGDEVSWNWGTGTARGTIKEVFEKKVRKTIKGSEIVRNADTWLRVLIRYAGPRVIWLLSGRDRLDAGGGGSPVHEHRAGPRQEPARGRHHHRPRRAQRDRLRRYVQGWQGRDGHGRTDHRPLALEHVVRCRAGKGQVAVASVVRQLASQTGQRSGLAGGQPSKGLCHISGMTPQHDEGMVVRAQACAGNLQRRPLTAVPVAMDGLPDPRGLQQPVRERNER